jgi:hypothetical protein
MGSQQGLRLDGLCQVGGSTMVTKMFGVGYVCSKLLPTRLAVTSIQKVLIIQAA